MADRKSAKNEENKAKNGEFSFRSLSFDPNKPRNRPDYLKWLTDEETIKYLGERKLNYGVLVANILYDNNAGNIVRSANAFGAKEIILYGHKKFDRRASVGTEFYTHFRHLRYVEDIDLLFVEYEEIVCVENTPDAISLNDFVWHKDKKTLIVVGQESVGIPREILKKCSRAVKIEQFGSVRSLNVAVAAGIVMNDYCTKLKQVNRHGSLPETG